MIFTKILSNLSIILISIYYLQSTPITEDCIECICEMMTGCDKFFEIVNQFGPYRITKDYWIDGGKETLKDDQFKDNETLFKNCARDIECSSKTVKNYMNRYMQTIQGKKVIIWFVAMPYNTVRNYFFYSNAQIMLDK